MSEIEDDPGPCVCTDCQNAREQATTAVIRPADEADECAHTALSLIYRRERDEALGRLEHRGILLSSKQAMLIDAESEIATLTARWTYQATIATEQAAIIAAQDATIERLWRELNEATNVPDEGSYIWVARGRQGGEPCIGGTRIPVDTLTRYADALGDEAALASYPSVNAADLKEARWYQDHLSPRPDDRCQGCSDEHCNAAMQAADDRRAL